MKIRQSLAVLGIFLCLAAGGASSAGPAAALIDLQGKPRQLSEFTGQGRWLVVMVWASTCHVCSAEAHEMVAYHAAHAGRDGGVVGVAIDGHENRSGVEQFIARHKLNFPNLIDDGSTIVEVFAREAGVDWQGWTPTYLVYDPAGRLVAKNIGPVSRQDLEQFMATYRPVAQAR